MNLVEALRTGKPLRRPVPRHCGSGRTGWLGHDYVMTLLTSTSSASIFGQVHEVQLINSTDILASDWEVKED